MPEEMSMIKHFHKRFVITTMALLAVATFVIFTAVVVTEYNLTLRQVNEKLEHAVKSMGNVISTDGGTGTSGYNDNSDNKDDLFKSDVAGIVIATPSITISDDATISVSSGGYRVNSTDTISSNEILSAMQEVVPRFSQENTNVVTGTLKDYDYYYRGEVKNGTYAIAFIPKSEFWGPFGQRLATIYGSWVLLMIAMFIITFYLSRYVARPVEKAWSDQQRFVGDASHELKTPLTVILADTSILMDNPDKTVTEQMTWVEGIHSEAESMQHLTEDLLTLAQADAGVDMKQVMGTVDFSSIVEGQVLQFDAVAFERGLTIADDVEPALTVMGDSMRLENMVKTLLENACKYAPTSTEIGVKLERAKGNAQLTIHNGGDPIPKEDLPHLFDRFYRSDKARTHEGEATSFGLGLSIAKSTAELHDGTISVKSDADGTDFIVKIPLAKQAKKN
ncbi:MAG: sensor histidine kinase [Coriobacteriales bacterium]|jgi:two-component system sensor histidine kinase CiaH